VDTVVHLAASLRDQPRGSIEELNGIATWRMVRAAERAGVEHFVFFSALQAAEHAAARFFRAKALAERAVRESGLRHTIFAPSIVYSPGDRYLTLLERLSLLPVMPVPGEARALFQPIWAEDVADCVLGALAREQGDARYELAGPDTISHEDIVRLVLRAFGRRRPLVHVSAGLVRRTLALAELALGPAAPATADEVELLDISMTAPRGTADAEALGVAPRAMAAVLGAG
jgi:NADH dehydrogenase